MADAEARWGSSVLKVTSSNASFSAAYAQAVDDMAALRLPTEDSTQDEFVPAAGLPWFVALQSAIVHCGARMRDEYAP
jgi:hypothetical protein